MRGSGFSRRLVDYDVEMRLSGGTKWSLWRLWKLALDGITLSGCWPKTRRKRLTFRKMVARCIPIRSSPSKPPSRCHTNQKPTRSVMTAADTRAASGSRTGAPAFRTLLASLRGDAIAMIFQDPLSALHPLCGRRADRGGDAGAPEGVSKAAARARAVELLEPSASRTPRQRVDTTRTSSRAACASAR